MFWFVIIASSVLLGAAAGLYFFLCRDPVQTPGAVPEPEKAPESEPAAEDSPGAEWFDRLKESGIVPNSTVEALIPTPTLGRPDPFVRQSPERCRCLCCPDIGPEIPGSLDTLRGDGVLAQTG